MPLEKPTFSTSTDRGLVLVTALATLVLCLILLSFSIKMVATHKTRELARKDVFLARAAAESGVAFARSKIAPLNHLSEILSLNGLSHQLNERQYFVLTIAMRHGYPLVTATGHSGQQNHEVQAFLGSRIYKQGRNALVVLESESGFYASGDSKIKGDVLLPATRIVSKALHKLPAAPEPVVLGTVTKAGSRDRPVIKPLIATMARRKILEANSIQVGLGRLPSGDTWQLDGATHKFDSNLVLPKRIRHIVGPGTVLIRGNLELSHPIRVEEDAWLVASGDIQANAPLNLTANLAAGGNLQAHGVTGMASFFAVASLSLSAMDLHFPSLSALIHLPELGRVSSPTLSLRDGTFAGSIFAWGPDSWLEPLIVVHPLVKASGIIYSPGRLELRAPYEGHVFTRVLRSSSGARTFTNWLKATQIDRTGIQELPVLPLGFSRDIQVLQWVRR